MSFLRPHPFFSLQFSLCVVDFYFFLYSFLSVWSRSKYYHVSFCVIRRSRLFVGGLIYLYLKMFLPGGACFLFELNTVKLSDMHEWTHILKLLKVCYSSLLWAARSLAGAENLKSVFWGFQLRSPHSSKTFCFSFHIFWKQCWTSSTGSMGKCKQFYLFKGPVTLEPS